MVYEEQKLLPVLDAEGPRSGSVSDGISESPLQGCRLLVGCSLMWWEGRGPLWGLFHKKTNPICEGSTLMTQSPSRGPTF